MKKYLFLFTLLISSATSVLSQTKDNSQVTAEVMPTYAHGSDGDMMAFIVKNLNINCTDVTDAKPGTVYVGFTVNTEGKVTNAEIKRSLHSCVDQSVLEVVKKLEFNPATQSGKPVNMEMVLPVRIELE